MRTITCAWLPHLIQTRVQERGIHAPAPGIIPKGGHLQTWCHLLSVLGPVRAALVANQHGYLSHSWIALVSVVNHSLQRRRQHSMPVPWEPTVHSVLQLDGMLHADVPVVVFALSFWSVPDAPPFWRLALLVAW
jgi:hypothetical protein